MNKLILLVFAVMVSFGCSKDVVKNAGNTNLRNTPSPNTELPDSPTVGTVQFVFANHGEIGTNDNLPTSNSFYNLFHSQTNPVQSASIMVKLPNGPTKRSFGSQQYGSLSVYINNQYVCHYYWANAQYVKHSSCPATVNVNQNDSVTILGIPQGETITFVYEYAEVL